MRVTRLLVTLVGSLSADDSRMRGTVKAIEERLTTNGFVARDPTAPEVDGLPPGAHFGHRDHSDRSIVIGEIGRS